MANFFSRIHEEIAAQKHLEAAARAAFQEKARTLRCLSCGSNTMEAMGFETVELSRDFELTDVQAGSRVTVALACCSSCGLMARYSRDVLGIPAFGIKV